LCFKFLVVAGLVCPLVAGAVSNTLNPASKHPFSYCAVTTGKPAPNNQTFVSNVSDVNDLAESACTEFAKNLSQPPTRNFTYTGCSILELHSDYPFEGPISNWASFSTVGRFIEKNEQGQIALDSPQDSRGLLTCGCNGGGPLYVDKDGGNASCYCAANQQWSEQQQKCVNQVDIDKTKLPSCPAVGNPIQPLLGTKREVFNTGMGSGAINLNITFDSAHRAPMADGLPAPMAADVAGFGALWFSSMHKRIAFGAFKLGARAMRGNGHVVSFNGSGGTFSSGTNVNDKLITTPGGYRYTDAAAQTQEIYDTNGLLLTQTHLSCHTLSFSYSTASTPKSVAPEPGHLLQVQDPFGRIMQFEYQLFADSSLARVSKITSPSGQVAVPRYDTKGNLTQFTWADASTRQFVYENAASAWALTGVVDELGKRYASFAYDAQGRAISTEHAGAVHKYSVTYQGAPKMRLIEIYEPENNILYRYYTWELATQPVVTSPTGAQSTWGVASAADQPTLTSTSQPAGSGCAASTANQTFDANGNITSRDDFNNTRACYVQDLTRNLESARVEGLQPTADCASVTTANAALPTGTRKISTQWHPEWRLETRLAEPGRITTRIYNGQPDPFTGTTASCAPADAKLPDGKPIAVLCKEVEQATTDLDGAKGFAATAQSGVALRQTQFTYNQFGQVLTRQDPLGHTTTYAYYLGTTAQHTLGDLQSVTNPKGHVMKYTQYNKAGQLLQSQSPNGVITVNTYDARQRLLSTQVGSQRSTYTYDAAGVTIQLYKPFSQL
jgi:YD repeat-containing protein